MFKRFVRRQVPEEKTPNEWARRKKLVWKRDKVFLTPERTTSQPEVRFLGHDMKSNQPDLPHSSSCTKRSMPQNRKPLPYVLRIRSPLPLAMVERFLITEIGIRTGKRNTTYSLANPWEKCTALSHTGTMAHQKT
jgi:hypothetical protein